MLLGLARDVIQSMDKDTLIVALVLVMVVLSTYMGYIAGSYNG
jgi:hypothetical protein